MARRGTAACPLLYHCASDVECDRAPPGRPPPGDLMHQVRRSEASPSLAHLLRRRLVDAQIVAVAGEGQAHAAQLARRGSHGIFML